MPFFLLRSWLFVLLLACAGAAKVQSQPLPSTLVAPSGLPPMQVSVHVDESAQASLADVLNKSFKPITLPYGRGMTGSASWFRIEIDPAQQAMPAVLMIRPQQLDSLRLYRQTPDGQWHEHLAGDQTPYTQRERHELYPSFDLQLNHKRSTVMYLRMQTVSSHNIHLQLMTPSQASAWDSGLQLGMGFYMGALLIIGLSSWLRWGVSRDSLWAAGAAFQIQTVVYLTFFMGFAARYIWPDRPAQVDFWTTQLSIMNLLLATLFHWVLFKRFSSHRWLAWVEAFLVALCVGFMALAWLGRPGLALGLMSLLMALSTLIGIVLVCFINTPHRQLRWVMRATYFMTIVTATYFALPHLGVMPMRENHLLPALVPIAGVVAMQFIVALYHDILKTRQAEQDRLRMQEVQLQLRNEEHQHAHTRHFMGMLLHELKNPLAAIRVAGQSLRRLLDLSSPASTRLDNIDRAVQSIDLVLERSRDMDRIDSSDSPLRLQAVALDPLIEDWVAKSGQAQRVQLQAPAPGQSLRTDPMLLGLMVNNLLDNALKYSPEGSPVQLHVSLAPEGHPSQLCVRVRNAVGRAGKPDTQRLFQKYYRADSAQYLSGTGLGLNWVQGVARQAQGQVQYIPEDQHIVFELQLPC